MSIVHVKPVRDLEVSTIKSWRVGVTPFIIAGGEVYFAYAIDRQYRQICNFAGGLKESDPDVIFGALREFAEESQGVFGPLSIEQVSHSIAIYDDDEFNIFLRVGVDADQVRRRFHRLVDMFGNPEVTDIIWLTTTELQWQLALGDNSLIYSRVRSLLSRFIAPPSRSMVKRPISPRRHRRHPARKRAHSAK